MKSGMNSLLDLHPASLSVVVETLFKASANEELLDGVLNVLLALRP